MVAIQYICSQQFFLTLCQKKKKNIERKLCKKKKSKIPCGAEDIGASGCVHSRNVKWNEEVPWDKLNTYSSERDSAYFCGTAWNVISFFFIFFCCLWPSSACKCSGWSVHRPVSLCDHGRSNCSSTLNESDDRMYTNDQCPTFVYGDSIIN